MAAAVGSVYKAIPAVLMRLREPLVDSARAKLPATPLIQGLDRAIRALRNRKSAPTLS